MKLQDKLVIIQGSLKAPKNQRNNFGKYNYRSCEDILEAVKPLLTEHNVALTITDMIDMIGDVMFVEATATLTYNDEKIKVSAQAGIDVNRKGMDISQSFGSSSSYARKYALNGLFLIDDTKDSDATNTHSKSSYKDTDNVLPSLPKSGDLFNRAKEAFDSGKVDIAAIRKRYKVSKEVEELLNTK